MLITVLIAIVIFVIFFLIIFAIAALIKGILLFFIKKRKTANLISAIFVPLFIVLSSSERFEITKLIYIIPIDLLATIILFYLFQYSDKRNHNLEKKNKQKYLWEQFLDNVK